MRQRRGFARLLPLAAIFGLGVGIGALLVSARPVHAPVLRAAAITARPITAPSDPAPSADADVLAAVFAFERNECQTVGGTWVFGTMTAALHGVFDINSAPAEPSPPLMSMDCTMLANFNRRNARSAPLPRFRSALPFLVVDQKRIDAFFPNPSIQDSHGTPNLFAGWRAFHRTFPQAGAVCDFSLPGYSSDYRHAMVWFSEQEDWVGGHSEMLTLAKLHGRWRVTWGVWLCRS